MKLFYGPWVALSNQIFSRYYCSYSTGSHCRLARLTVKMEAMEKRICAEKVWDDVQFWRKNPKKKNVTAVISGLAGTGKSSLVNALFGDSRFAEVGHYTEPKTKKPQEHYQWFGDEKLIIWDTPGFAEYDAERLLSNDGVLTSIIASKCLQKERHDVFLYAVSMTKTRFEENSGDINAMKKLTHAFGPDLWDNAVITLAQANIAFENFKENKERERKYIEEKAKAHKEKRLEKYLKDCEKKFVLEFVERKLRIWIDRVKEFLKSELNLSDERVNNIAIVPAGYDRTKVLSFEPKGKLWFLDLLLQIARATKLDSQPVMLNFCMHQLLLAPKIYRDSLVSYVKVSSEIYQRRAVKSTEKLENSMKCEIGLAVSFLYAQEYLLKNKKITTEKIMTPVTEEYREDSDYWLLTKSSIELMFIGGSVSGKTTLANSMFYGKENVKENHVLEPETSITDRKVKTAENISCQIWDISKASQIKEKYDEDKTGLIMLCIRISDSEEAILEALRSIAPPLSWKKVVIVLTYANLMEKDQYDMAIETKKRQLYELMVRNSELSEGQAKCVEIIPAGYHRRLKIEGDEDCPYWIIKFWFKVISAAEAVYQPTLIELLQGRIYPNIIYRQKEYMEMYYKLTLHNTLLEIVNKELKFVTISSTFPTS